VRGRVRKISKIRRNLKKQAPIETIELDPVMNKWMSENEGNTSSGWFDHLETADINKFGESTGPYKGPDSKKYVDEITRVTSKQSLTGYEEE
jgi:hypothetical protein